MNLADVERDLRARLAEVKARIEELTEPPETGGGISFGKRIGEGTNEAISRFANVGVANDLYAIEQRIERALAKVDEGSYGTCDNCGRDIAERRLRSAPESALCIECARKHE